VNFWLNRAGVNLERLSAADMEMIRSLPEGLPKESVTTETLFAKFCITSKDELVRLAALAGRQLASSVEDTHWETSGTSEVLGHPGQYPKVYRLDDDNAHLFPTANLARLHVNRRAEDDREVDEFMKVLAGYMEWFFEIDGDIGLVAVPEGFQAYYHGNGQHGGYIHSESRAVVLSQIVGPRDWEMAYTGTPNTTLEQMLKLKELREAQASEAA